MNKILILDNRDSFSYNLKHLLSMSGKHMVDVVPTQEYSTNLLDHYDALVLSPGPGLPDDHEKLKKAIKDAVGQLPIWGVCLGHQAIAEVFGGSLYQLPLVFHGIKSELKIIDHHGLWKGITTADPVGRYHSWMVSENNFPAILQITSKDESGRIMSFRHKKLPIFGVQFHPESYMTNHGDLLAYNFMEFIGGIH